jgi:hypothetical protein
VASTPTIEEFVLELDETQETTETLAKDFAHLASSGYQLAPVSAETYELLSAAKSYLEQLAQILALINCQQRLALPRLEVPRE